MGVGFNADVILGPPVRDPFLNFCAGVGLCDPAIASPNIVPFRHRPVQRPRRGFRTLDFWSPARSDDLFTNFNNIANLTWVKGNHTFKFGGSLNFEGFYVKNVAAQTFGFSSAETAEPYQVKA